LVEYDPADSANEGAYVAALEGGGLRAAHPRARLVRTPDAQGDGADVSLHVFSAGCPEIDRMLLFGDLLRGDPAERDRCAAVKRRLAAQRWRHVQNCADAKTVVVDEIL
jgi:GrpB-like predicted nucleotidyltransferase (UPF0157 family)